VRGCFFFFLVRLPKKDAEGGRNYYFLKVSFSLYLFAVRRNCAGVEVKVKMYIVTLCWMYAQQNRTADDEFDRSSKEKESEKKK
jgi:hypothetical protein